MKYIEEAPHIEAMNTFYADKHPEPHKHRIWTGDFMAACTHDIACQVCFDNYAMIERQVDPGHWHQAVQPCIECQKKGYRVYRLPKWIERALLKFGYRG